MELTNLNALRALIAQHDDLRLHLDHSAYESDRRADEQQRSRRTAWRVAAGFGATAAGLLAVTGVALHSSLRPAPPPQILVVERATGKIEPLVSLAAYQIKADDAIVRRYVATFLRARENYNLDNAEDAYFDAAAFMSAPLQAQWIAYWDTANPDSPMNVYKKDGKVRTEVGAITLLRSGAGAITGARVTFTRTVTRGGVTSAPTSWIATLAFHWTNAPTSERERRINELGWEVTSYDVDRDLGAAAPALAAPAAPRQPAAAARADLALTAPQVAP